MTAKEYVKTLNPNNSYWLINGYDVERLNEVPATAENLYIVFECEDCSEEEKQKVYHAVPYTNLKADEYGDYVVWCPDREEEGYAAWLNGGCVPEELQTLFDETDFETYVEPEDDDCDDDCDDYDEDEEEDDDADEEDDCGDYDEDEEEAD